MELEPTPNLTPESIPTLEPSALPQRESLVISESAVGEQKMKDNADMIQARKELDEAFGHTESGQPFDRDFGAELSKHMEEEMPVGKLEPPRTKRKFQKKVTPTPKQPEADDYDYLIETDDKGEYIITENPEKIKRKSEPIKKKHVQEIPDIDYERNAEGKNFKELYKEADEVLETIKKSGGDYRDSLVKKYRSLTKEAATLEGKPLGAWEAVHKANDMRETFLLRELEGAKRALNRYDVKTEKGKAALKRFKELYAKWIDVRNHLGEEID